MTQTEAWLARFREWSSDRDILQQREEDPEVEVPQSEWDQMHSDSVDLLYEAGSLMERLVD